MPHLIFILARLSASQTANFVSVSRSFLYRYDYGSETNLQLPKCSASADSLDEDLVSSLCLAKTEDSRKRGEKKAWSTEVADGDHSCISKDNHKDRAPSEDISSGEYSQHLENMSAIKTKCEVLTDGKIKPQSGSCCYTESGPKIYEDRKAKFSCGGKTEHDHFKLQRAHTSPTLNISNDLKSKHENKPRRRARSVDNNIHDKKQLEILLESN